MDVNLLRFSPLKVYETFCDFNFCGFQKPVNSKIQKKKKKKKTREKEMAQDQIRYCKLIIIITLSSIITLSRGAKQMFSDIKISEISFPFGFESGCGI